MNFSTVYGPQPPLARWPRYSQDAGSTVHVHRPLEARAVVVKGVVRVESDMHSLVLFGSEGKVAAQFAAGEWTYWAPIEPDPA